VQLILLGQVYPSVKDCRDKYMPKFNKTRELCTRYHKTRTKSFYQLLVQTKKTANATIKNSFSILPQKVAKVTLFCQ